MAAEFDGKVVLITGGSRGIGRACVEAFVQAGATVEFTYVSQEAKAFELASKYPGKVKAVRLDVADVAACETWIEAVVASRGGVDVLVNNAGVSLDALLVRAKNEDWEKTLAVNLRAAFVLARSVAKPMMKKKSGCIVNVTSAVAEMGNAGQSMYAASKAGLLGLTKSVARELASRNIRVNAVAPGWVATDMTGELLEKNKEALLTSVPLGRAAQPDEVAHAVLFLASAKASYITGETLRVNGGMLM